MRRLVSLLLIAAAALIAPVAAAAAPTAVTKQLPLLPAVGRGFTGIITVNGVVAYAEVGPATHTSFRVWRLSGRHWRVVVKRATREPYLSRSSVVVACPFVSTDGGRSFRRARNVNSTFCTRPLSPPSDVKSADGWSFRALPDLNAMLVRAPGANGWTASAPAFDWTDNNGYPEAVTHFEAFGSPLRLVLFRGRFGSRGSVSTTPFWSTDIGATWHEGAATPGNAFASDGFGGGRIYAVWAAVDEAVGSIPAAISYSTDLGATWHKLLLPGGRDDFDLVLQQGPAAGALAVIGSHIWATDDAGATAATLAEVPPHRHVDSSTIRYGDWLIIARRKISRVTLTG